MSYLDKKNGGGNLIKITPSARKGIHSDSESYRPFALTMDEMNFKRMRERSIHGQHRTMPTCMPDDHDEVDANVMSKPCRSRTPSPLKRRNSIQHYGHELRPDTNCELGKSLPTYLYPKTYSSYRETSPRYKNTSYTYSSSQESSFSETMQTCQPESSWSEDSPPRETARKTQKPESSFLSNNVVIGGIVALIAMLSLYFYEDIVSSTNNYVLRNKALYDELKYSQDLDVLGVKYNLNDDSKLQVLTGMSTIHQKEIAGSFIFVYNSKKKTFDKKHFNDVVDQIASASAKYLRNTTLPVQHLVVQGSRLGVRQHGELITKYRDQIAAKGVMLVEDVDHVPANLAMAFHYYCDEYDPLVKKSAIFFTLDLENCSFYNGERSIYSLLERCLEDKWQGLQQDNIGPLLTRVVSVVVDIL